MELTLENCLKYVDEGWLTKHESTDGKLIGFKYSLATTYEQHWDEITLQCRGIAFEKSTGRIVAWPFNKFFNYGEIFDAQGYDAHIGKILRKMEYKWRPFTSNEYTIAEKVDGSLGIAYYYDGEWYVKTGGSFNSDQAIWATKFLRENLCGCVMMEDYTYCFEIVYKGDVHVVHYDEEELVLLAAFDSDHNEVERGELVGMASAMGCRVANEYKFKSLEECIEEVSKMDVNHEGVVMTFFNGEDTFKVKIKSEEYLEMFHRMSCITYKEIRDHFNEEWGCIDKDFAASIPEELVEMKEYVERINTMVAEKFNFVAEVGIAGGQIEDARSRYEYVAEHAGNLTGATMAFIKWASGCHGKKSVVYHSIFQRVKEELKEA